MQNPFLTSKSQIADIQKVISFNQNTPIHTHLYSFAINSANFVISEAEIMNVCKKNRNQI